VIDRAINDATGEKMTRTSLSCLDNNTVTAWINYLVFKNIKLPSRWK